MSQNAVKRLSPIGFSSTYKTAVFCLNVLKPRHQLPGFSVKKIWRSKIKCYLIARIGSTTRRQQALS